MTGLRLLTALLLAALTCPASLAQDDGLYAGFAEPAKEFHPRVWWHWMNGNVTKDGIRKDLLWMDRAGIAGFHQFNAQLNPTDVIVKRRLPLFSEEWKEAFRYSIELADSLGMEAGIAASPGWSITGGPWVRPEDAQKKLCWRTATLTGGCRTDFALPEPIEYSGPFQDIPQYPRDLYRYRFYEDIAVLAIRKSALERADTTADWKKKAGFEVDFRVGTRSGSDPDARGIAREDIVDVTSKVHDGRLKWNAPEGEWVIYRFGYNLLGRVNGPVEKAGVGLEADKLSRKAMENYFRTYLGIMDEASGGRLGSVVKYLMIDSYEAGKGTWTPLMPKEFKSRRGYSLIPWLPALTGLVVGDAESTDAFLADWKATLGELIVENHYDLAAGLLKDYGMGAYVESHESGTAFIGDGMMPKRNAAVPMGAIWVNYGTGVYADDLPARADIKESSSVAHIYGQNICAAESFSVNSRPTVEGHFPAYRCSPSNLKRLADAALASGLNRFVMHCSPHQPEDDRIPGLGLGSFGNWFTRHDTWAEEARPWHDYLARNCYMLQQGQPRADIALLYPEDDNATGIYRRKPLALPDGYDFDLMNADALENMTSVRDGAITTQSGMAYRVLLVDPEMRRYSVPLLRRLSFLARRGVVICATRPDGRARLSDSELLYERFVRDIWDKGRPNVIEGWCPEEALSAAGLEPDFRIVGGRAEGLRFVHRSTDSAEIYFLANISPTPTGELRASFRCRGLKPMKWDAGTGRRSEVYYETVGDRTEVLLAFGEDDSFFIVFEGAGGPSERPTQYGEGLELALEGWKLKFQSGRGAPEGELDAAPSDWAESPVEGIRHFSGTAEYRVSFTPPEGSWDRAVLDLGDVEVMARVALNGKDLGLLWHRPYRVDITDHVRKGASNALNVKVTNLWPNRMTGDASKPKSERFTYTPWQFYQADSTLVPSGLIGPVRLVFESEL